MTPLNSQQKQLLFDYSLGLTSPNESAEAQRLITTNQKALDTYHSLQNTLSPLDTWEIEPCPDELVDATVLRLKESFAEQAGQDRLSRLLEAQETSGQVIRFPTWRSFSNLAAVAAVIVVVGAILIPALGSARQRYWQYRCEQQFGNIYTGLANYVSDFDGRMPRVATAAGAPWWKVGDQGQENHSNTRQAWLLVREGYVPAQDFLCPARGQPRTPSITPVQASQYNDFPNRDYIHFSVRVGCPDSPPANLSERRAILADLNPISEQLPVDHSQPFTLRLCKELMMYNSPNHGRRGQNVLFCNGSVEFTRTRHTSVSDDDIYTLREMSDGCEIHGCEVPVAEDDAFLVP
jgi:hypothetical protein